MCVCKREEVQEERDKDLMLYKGKTIDKKSRGNDKEIHTQFVYINSHKTPTYMY